MCSLPFKYYYEFSTLEQSVLLLFIVTICKQQSQFFHVSLLPQNKQLKQFAKKLIWQQSLKNILRNGSIGWKIFRFIWFKDQILMRLYLIDARTVRNWNAWTKRFLNVKIWANTDDLLSKSWKSKAFQISYSSAINYLLIIIYLNNKNAYMSAVAYCYCKSCINCIIHFVIVKTID